MTPEEAQAALDRVGGRPAALETPAGDGSSTPEATSDFLWKSRLTALTHLAAGDDMEAARTALTAAGGIRAELHRAAVMGTPFAARVLELLAGDPWWAEAEPGP